MKSLTALVTGANKSIGLETVRLLAGAGYHVFLGSRDRERGEAAVAGLRSAGFDAVEMVLLDVTREESVQEAFTALSGRVERLDVLVNNAGIPGQFQQAPSAASHENLERVFETNLFGAVRMIRVFIPLLRKSPRPRIVNVTSDLASLTLHNDPSWAYYPFKSPAYGPSKTALNAYTVALAYELKDTSFKVNAVNPGYTATDFNQHRGTKKVEEAARVIAEYAMLGEEGPTGKFVSDYGETPW
ncbi:SDR family oxidoreductase [Puia sp.]|jgi:NAD(P)-dependent dehydrogenase (short-subunit alcohol dehydrogenase family)|uniref:SDR family oxidoreductase n=1 Tax=Puia sp. TaxID=2045100 RepID=UPI002F3EEF4A